MRNVKTLALLATLTALLMWGGQLLGGNAGMALALVFAGVMNIGAYWFSDRIVLRMHQAREVTEYEAPELHRMVHDLAMRAGLPMPRLFIMPEGAPNAFATGRDPKHGVVAVTEGLLRVLDRRETAAVIAHELGHIKNRDTLIMAIAATFAGAMSMIANAAMWGSLFGGHDDEDGSPAASLLGVMVAPFAAMLVQMSISRTREFGADEAAVRNTGEPLALASALRKIEAYSEYAPMQAATPATAHLFIHNPFTLRGVATLFSTHPSTDARIERLEAMASGRRPVAA